MGFFSEKVGEIKGKDFTAEIHKEALYGPNYTGTAKTADGTTVHVVGKNSSEVRSELLSAVRNTKK